MADGFKEKEKETYVVTVEIKIAGKPYAMKFDSSVSHAGAKSEQEFFKKNKLDNAENVKATLNSGRAKLYNADGSEMNFVDKASVPELIRKIGQDEAGVVLHFKKETKVLKFEG